MGTISIEHGNRLFWLGRYAERVFTTLTAIEKVYDRTIDGDPKYYKKYLSCFGLYDNYGDADSFIKSFIFDKDNPGSVFYSLERAYDNGIVLREEISTEALSFLQLAMDKLEKSSNWDGGLLYSLLPIKDILFGFWGCIEDYVYDDEILTIIRCGKTVERLDLYLRLEETYEQIQLEFNRLCRNLSKVPKNTPYRYNTKRLSVLVELMGMGESYTERVDEAIMSLGRLFEK